MLSKEQAVIQRAKCFNASVAQEVYFSHLNDVPLYFFDEPAYYKLACASTSEAVPELNCSLHSQTAKWSEACESLERLKVTCGSASMLKASWPEKELLPKQLFSSPPSSKLREVTLGFPINTGSFYMLECLINNTKSLRALSCEVRSFPSSLKSLGPNFLEVLRLDQDIFNLSLLGHLLARNPGTLRTLELSLGKRDSTVGDINQVLCSLESLTRHEAYRKLESLALRVVTMPTFFDVMAEHKSIKLFLKGFRKL